MHWGWIIQKENAMLYGQFFSNVESTTKSGMGGYESQQSDSAKEEGKSCTSESNILAEMPQPTRAAGDVNITLHHQPSSTEQQN